MNKDRVIELAKKLTDLSESHTVGWRNEHALQEMTPLLQQLINECCNNDKMHTHLVDAKKHLGIMFSPRKHLKKGGAEATSSAFRSALNRALRYLNYA